MKVILLDNLLIHGCRCRAGDEIEVDDGVALHLMKENLAIVGVKQVDEDLMENAPIEAESTAIPEEAFAPIPQAQEEPEEENQEPKAAKRTTSRKKKVEQ